MKELEIVSHFKASFLKKSPKPYFFLFSRKNNFNTRLYEKVIYHYYVLLDGFCRIDAQQAKYVFYFIGDGMGVNQVQGTELYLGELEGKIGITPLQFTQFPTQP